jgi:hypothetical protein
MARLTPKARAKLPKGKFLGPDRTFPANDKIHAEKAAQMAPRSYHAGNISKSTEEKIIAGAHKLLGMKTDAQKKKKVNRAAK